MSDGHHIVALRRTLLASAMFAFVFWGAIPASAAPLCVGGEDFVDGGDGICRNFFPGDNAKFYLFDDASGFEHLLRVTVDQVLFGPENEEGGTGGFGLRFVASLLPAGSTFPGFPQYTCVAYGPPDTSGNPQCVEYEGVQNDGTPIDGTAFQPVRNTDYAGGPITWLIAWALDVGTSPIPEIIHEIGENGDTDEIYDEVLQGVFFSPNLGPFDFACDNPYYDTCSFSEFSSFSKPGGPDDPVRASLSDNFTDVALVQAVPEPGTLALLGLGASGLLLNRRRRNSRK